MPHWEGLCRWIEVRRRAALWVWSAKAADGAELARGVFEFDDGGARALRTALAKHLGLSPRVIPGKGRAWSWIQVWRGGR